MPSNQELAFAFVRFGEKGLSDLIGNLGTVKKAFDVATTAMKAAESAGKRVADALKSALAAPSAALDAISKKINEASKALADSPITKIAKAFSFSGALGLGGIAAGAMRGTVEADRLGASMERLMRVLGDKLAPYVRAAAQAINELTAFFERIDGATMAAVTKWTLFGTAVAGVVALLPSLVAAFGVVVAAVGALLTPIPLVIAGVAAIVAAFTDWFSFASTGSADAAVNITNNNRDWFETITEWLATLGTNFASMWNKVVGMAAAAATTIYNKFQEIKAAGKSLFDWFDALTDPRFQSWDEKVNRWQQLNAKNFEEADANKKTFSFDAATIDADKFGQKIESIGKNMRDIVAPAIKRITDAAGGAQGFSLKANSSFEGFGGTYDRLQVAFANQAAVDIPRRQLTQLEEMNGKLGGLNTTMDKIADAVPAVR